MIASCYYYRAEYYDSSVGRFLSEDPAAFNGGQANLYVDVRNNPTAYKDPSGRVIQISGDGESFKEAELYLSQDLNLVVSNNSVGILGWSRS